MKIPHAKFIFVSLLLLFLTSTNAPFTSANPEDGFILHIRPILHHPDDQAPPHILYSIPLKNAEDHLTDDCCIAKNNTGFDERKQSFLNLFRDGNPTTIQTTSTFDFFQSLVTNGKYTYILKENELTFIKAYSVDDCKTCIENHITRRQKASKHLFLTNFAQHVQMAGEFRVYQPHQDSLFVVFDNGSGNYAPHPSRIAGILAILNENLKSDPRIVFIGKTHEQQFDPNTLEIVDLPQ